MRQVNPALALCVAALIIGCGGKEEAKDPVHMGMMVHSDSHKVVVWVNEEPVKVFLPGSGGSVPLYWVGETGENQVWVTTEREVEEGDPFVAVEIKEGTWDKPDEIIDHFSWESSADTEQSPTFTYRQSSQFGATRSSFAPLTIDEEEARRHISERYQEIADALAKKDLSLMGIDKAEYNTRWRTFMNIDDFYEKVFEIDDYTSRANVEPDELELVFGKRTVLAYPTNGENVFEAGPLDRESTTGEWKLSMIIESIAMGYDGSKWVPAF